MPSQFAKDHDFYEPEEGLRIRIQKKLVDFFDMTQAFERNPESDSLMAGFITLRLMVLIEDYFDEYEQD